MIRCIHMPNTFIASSLSKLPVPQLPISNSFIAPAHVQKAQYQSWGQGTDLRTARQWGFLTRRFVESLTLAFADKEEPARHATTESPTRGYDDPARAAPAGP